MSDPKRAVDPDAMRALMDEAGLFEASDLQFSEEYLSKLAALLKGSQRKRFETLMHLKA